MQHPIIRAPVVIPASAAAMQDSEAGWERFRSDIRGCRTVEDTNQPKPALQFHIPIRPRPPKYRPGSGPPPPRIDLRPVHDSDAFIVDKVVLPRGRLLPHEHARQRRCYYIIGWPDLPAARPVVEASRVLDYVSPRTLEDWEYQDALRREEEREKEEEAEKRAAATDNEVVTGADGVQPGAKRRRGRPPRAMMIAAEPPPEPELNSEQEEMIHKRMRGPSLSTPQKSRLAQLVAEEEILEQLEGAGENAEAAVHRQLEGLGEVISDGDENVGMAENLGSLRLSSAVPGRSSGESSRASSARPSIGNPPGSLARTATTAGMVAHAAALSSPSRRTRDRNSPASPSRSAQVMKRPAISTTPIPLPSHYSQLIKLPKSHSKDQVATTDPRPQVGAGQGSGSTPLQSDPSHSRHSSSANTSAPCTSGFTPIGGSFPRPPKRPAESSPISAVAPTRTKAKKGKNRQAELTREEDEVPTEVIVLPDPGLDLIQGEEEYIVKRLEGDYILDGIHWFKVRWEGDWPDDKNPTWEPRQNIAEKLVKEYLKRKAKRGAHRLSRPKSKKQAKTKQTSLLADWARGYSSVADAFDGQAENPPSDAMLTQSGGLDGHVDDDGPDKLLVAEGDDEAAAMERRKAMEAQVVAEFANMARAAPHHF